MDNTYKAYVAGFEMGATGEHIGAFDAYRDAAEAGRFQANETAARWFIKGWNWSIAEDEING